VAKFMSAISRWFWDDVELRWLTTNGQSSVLVIREGRVSCMLTINGSAEGVEHVLWMFNPDKLAAVAHPA
jgi:RNA polymerase sigma-70 factor (ECF subfamily)